MTTVRDEVRALVDRAQSSGWFHKPGDTQREGDDLLERMERDVNEVTDAITSLVLGVKELDWKEVVEGIWFDQNGIGGTYQIEFDEQRQKYQSWLNTAGAQGTVGVADTLEAAKAACQRDFAKRIQSALTAKPAPVVSDDALRKILEDEFKTAVATGPAVDRTILRIKQALSHATTEADIRADAQQMTLESVTVESLGARSAHLKVKTILSSPASQGEGQ